MKPILVPSQFRKRVNWAHILLSADTIEAKCFRIIRGAERKGEHRTAVDWRENMCGCRTICRILSRAYHIEHRNGIYSIYLCCLFRTLLPALYNSLCSLRCGNVAVVRLPSEPLPRRKCYPLAAALPCKCHRINCKRKTSLSRRRCRCVCFFSRCSGRIVFHRRSMLTHN